MQDDKQPLSKGKRSATKRLSTLEKTAQEGVALLKVYFVFMLLLKINYSLISLKAIPIILAVANLESLSKAV